MAKQYGSCQRGLWLIGRIAAIDDNDTQQPRQYEVKTKTGTFTLRAIHLTLIEAEERLRHDDDDDSHEGEEEEEAKIITQRTRTHPSNWILQQTAE